MAGETESIYEAGMFGCQFHRFVEFDPGTIDRLERLGYTKTCGDTIVEVPPPEALERYLPRFRINDHILWL
jgi:hypothetical protein